MPGGPLHPRSGRGAVRDLSWVGHVCYLEFARRRFKCARCRRPFTEVVEAVAPQARCARRYERYLFAQCRGSTIQEVGRRERLSYKTVEGHYYRLAAQHEAETIPKPVSRLGIDESALKKGRGQYVLILTDLERKRVIAALCERTKGVLEAYVETWRPEHRAAVVDVALDLWEPYHLAVRAKWPNARITGDRFQVLQNRNDRVTQARRAIQRAALATQKKRLKGFQWLLVKNHADLDAQEQAKLAEMYTAAPILGRLHELKEAFRTIGETAPDRATAAARLRAWIAKVEASDLSSLRQFVATLHNWWDALLSYFHDRLTSGFVEGRNNMLKLLKRRAFDYRNFAHFRLQVLIECDGRPAAR